MSLYVEFAQSHQSRKTQGGNIDLIKIMNHDSKTKYLFKNNLFLIIMIILIISLKGF